MVVVAVVEAVGAGAVVVTAAVEGVDLVSLVKGDTFLGSISLLTQDLIFSRSILHNQTCSKNSTQCTCNKLNFKQNEEVIYSIHLVRKAISLVQNNKITKM